MSDTTILLREVSLDTKNLNSNFKEIDTEVEVDYSFGESSSSNADLEKPDSSKIIENTKINHFNFIVVNKWKGEVTAIKDKEFEAVITDLSEEGTKEEISFSFYDVTEDDIDLIQEGAIFYWKIGYHVHRGIRMKGSILKFRRMPKLSKRKIDQILDYANRMTDELKID